MPLERERGQRAPARETSAGCSTAASSPTALKKTKIEAAQTPAAGRVESRCRAAVAHDLQPRVPPGRSRAGSRRRGSARSTTTRRRAGARSTGSARRCSWMKKKCANSGLRDETSTNQGAVSARISSAPLADMQPAPEREVAGDHGVDDEYQPRQDDADQALGQDGDRHRGPGEPHPASTRHRRRRGCWAISTLASTQARAAETPMSSEIEVAAEVPARRGQRARRLRGTATRRPEPAPRRRSPSRPGQEPVERGPQPRLPFADAERLERERRHPIWKRGLLEVLEAVVARRHPVAGGHHLAGDLGVAPLVGAEQMARVEGQKPDAGDRHDHAPDDVSRPCRVRDRRGPVPHSGARPDRRVELIGRGLGLHQPPALEAGELADRAARLVGADDRIELEHAAQAARDPLVVVADVLAAGREALHRDALGTFET